MLLSHDDLGSGPPVVLLHAGVCDRRMWGPVLPALSHAFRVIAPDLRGFGQSALPGGPVSHAEDVADLMEHLGIGQVAVVGSSFGGRVALEVAVLHPGRVSALALLCPAFRGIEPSGTMAAFGEEEDRLLEAGDLDGAVELNVRMWLGPEASAEARDLVRDMQRRAFEVQLAADAADPPPSIVRVDVDPTRIAVPTVVVSGDHDDPHFAQVADHLAGHIEGAERVRLPWAGHLPAVERPDAILALLLDVLRNDPLVHAP